MATGSPGQNIFVSDGQPCGAGPPSYRAVMHPRQRASGPIMSSAYPQVLCHLSVRCTVEFCVRINGIAHCGTMEVRYHPLSSLVPPEFGSQWEIDGERCQGECEFYVGGFGLGDFFQIRSVNFPFLG